MNWFLLFQVNFIFTNLMSLYLWSPYDTYFPFLLLYCQYSIKSRWLFTNYNLFHWYFYFLLSFIQTIHKQYNFTTLYYFFNNSNKQTTFFKLCFYFSHHLTEQESKQSFSSIQSNPFSFPSLYHCLFVLKINNKTNLKHRHNIKPNHMNNSLSLISKTVFNNRFTGSFALIIRQI